jgi:adenosylmethionine-8-amino-7-oxononanoate aminotransferase
MDTLTKHSHVFHRKYKFNKPAVARGEGIYLWDTEGRRYIDASGGAVVVNVGHGVTEIADAIGQQAASVAYAHASMFTSPVLEEHALRLAAHLPMDDARLFYMASGSEATETAMKLARQVQMAMGNPSRYKVIARWGAYHGATLGALAITGKPSMRTLYAPMFVDMPHIPAPYPYRFEGSPEECGRAAGDALAEEIERQGPETVAAFIGEPIAGATLGAVVPPDNYWPRIREICDHYGILLIADEVMTGMGRTGRWCGIEHWNVQPDIVCLGKGVSGGYLPLSVTAARGDLVDLLLSKTGDFNHGGTFSHQPVAVAAGLAALQYLEDRDLINHAAQVGEYLGQRLHAAFDQHPHVGEVRGTGLMWALEFVEDRASKQTFPAKAHLASSIFDYGFADGLIVYYMSGCVDGTAGDHVMVSPPLVVTEREIDEIVAKLAVALDAAISAL